MVEKLMELGVKPRKARTVQMPPVPDKYLSHFFRGVFEGDGTIFIKNGQPTLNIYSSSKGFLSEMNRRISEAAGIKCGSIYNVKRYDVNTLYFGSHKRIECLFDFMYSGVPKSMILERKYDKFFGYIQQRTGDDVDHDKHQRAKKSNGEENADG
jgi:hypothetical protein